MEEATKKKGTVTSLESLFPPEDSQKASERVQNAILERQKNLDQLKGFIADNANLINLVQTLPNELRHDIMVPFGKAAFFPGQLIHTNEFMVLLGEGYFAERTSKQTVEILKRRGKDLDSQVENLKAEIQDLKVEASFFNATAEEATDGLVQIVEDYVEETSTHDINEPGKSEIDSSTSFKAESSVSTAEDEEFERIFSRIAELEKEEEEAENAELEEEEEEAENAAEDEKDEEDEQKKDDLSPKINQLSLAQEVQSLKVDGSNPVSLHKDGPSHGEAPASSKPGLTKKPWELPGVKETVQAPGVAEKEVNVRPLEVREPGSSTRKAFTGTIVEHIHSLEPNQMEQSPGRSSKPVSRFKSRRQ